MKMLKRLQRAVVDLNEAAWELESRGFEAEAAKIDEALDAFEPLVVAFEGL